MEAAVVGTKQTFDHCAMCAVTITSTTTDSLLIPMGVVKHVNLQVQTDHLSEHGL